MKKRNKDSPSYLRKIVIGSSKWCAYRQLYTVLASLARGDKLSDQAKGGRNIALLGLFCPFFWFALFSGANSATLAMHATHSGLVFLVGIILMVLGLIKQN